MKVSDKIKIVDALVEIKITLNRYGEMIGEYSPNPESRTGQLKKAYESIEQITEIIKQN